MFSDMKRFQLLPDASITSTAIVLSPSAISNVLRLNSKNELDVWGKLTSSMKLLACMFLSESVVNSSLLVLMIEL